MQITGLQLALWLTGTIGFAALTLQFLVSKLAGRWPSIFCYALLHSVGNPLLYWQMPVYKHYFWMFWIREALLALVRIWIVVDILRSIPKIKHMPRPITVGTLMLCATLASTVWVLLSPGMHGLPTVSLATRMNQCVTLSWAAVLIGMVAGFAMSGFGFLLSTARVTTGYAILVTSGLGLALVYSAHLPRLINLRAFYATSVAEIAVIGYWIYSFARHDDDPGLTPSQDSELIGFMHSLFPSSITSSTEKEDAR